MVYCTRTKQDKTRQDNTRQDSSQPPYPNPIVTKQSSTYHLLWGFRVFLPSHAFQNDLACIGDYGLWLAFLINKLGLHHITSHQTPPFPPPPHESRELTDSSRTFHRKEGYDVVSGRRCEIWGEDDGAAD